MNMRRLSVLLRCNRVRHGISSKLVPVRDAEQIARSAFSRGKAMSPPRFAFHERQKITIGHILSDMEPRGFVCAANTESTAA